LAGKFRQQKFRQIQGSFRRADFPAVCSVKSAATEVWLPVNKMFPPFPPFPLSGSQFNARFASMQISLQPPERPERFARIFDVRFPGRAQVLRSGTGRDVC
jgi:hypothetical protein